MKADVFRYSPVARALYALLARPGGRWAIALLYAGLGGAALASGLGLLLGALTAIVFAVSAAHLALASGRAAPIVPLTVIIQDDGGMELRLAGGRVLRTDLSHVAAVRERAMNPRLIWWYPGPGIVEVTMVGASLPTWFFTPLMPRWGKLYGLLAPGGRPAETRGGPFVRMSTGMMILGAIVTGASVVFVSFMGADVVASSPGLARFSTLAWLAAIGICVVVVLWYLTWPIEVRVVEAGLSVRSLSRSTFIPLADLLSVKMGRAWPGSPEWAVIRHRGGLLRLSSFTYPEVPRLVAELETRIRRRHETDNRAGG